MHVPKKINNSRLFSDEDFLSRCPHEESLQLRWEYTCDARKSAHLDAVSMHEGLIPSEAVSDIEFLSETNKQYAELGPNKQEDRPEMQVMDNNCKNVTPYVDRNFPSDSSTTSETDDDFETVYDTDTGETKVKLGQYEYIIDTSSYFADTEDTHHNHFTDYKFSKAVETLTRKPVDYIPLPPTTQMTPEEIMLIDTREQCFSAMKNENWKYEGKDLENRGFIYAQHSVTVPEFRRNPEEVAKRCIQSCFCKEEEQRCQSDHHTRTEAYTSPQPPVKTECDPVTSMSNEMNSNDCTKALPSIETFNQSFETDSSECNNKTNGPFIDRTYYGCEHNNHLGPYTRFGTTNSLQDSEFIPRSEQLMFSFSYEPICQYHTHLEQKSNKAFQEGKMAFYKMPYASSKPTGILASTQDQANTHLDGLCHERNNQSRLKLGSCSTNIPSQFSDFSKYRHIDNNCSDMEIERPHTVDRQLEERLFKATDPSPKRKWKRGCRLWEYIRNLLLDPSTNPVLIKWVDRTEGTFKLVQNKAIAHMWGMKKGNGDMSYEKLSRAMRYYYKKQIFQPVIGKRLVYKFGPRATGWKESTR